MLEISIKWLLMPQLYLIAIHSLIKSSNFLRKYWKQLKDIFEIESRMLWREIVKKRQLYIYSEQHHTLSDEESMDITAPALSQPYNTNQTVDMVRCE